MRWYGPHDKVQLEDLKQCGITGIVTALHQIPAGDIWTVDEIKKRQQLVRDVGLEWTVIESLPVHEDIKRGEGNYKQYIENYKISLKNIAQCGIEVITYNFMPVLDWVRTHHSHKNPDGTRALLYNKTAFIFFDVFLLKRPNAEQDYTQEEVTTAKEYGDSLSEEDKNTLFRSVLLGLPGSTENFTAEQVLSLLDDYKHIDDEKLRKNLVYFLSEVAPVAERLGLKLAIHPDDPPFSVLGLPRVVCTQDDLRQIFDAVPFQANGLCYCTGSLGAQPNNDLLSIIDDFEDRIHFLHLRNVVRENENIFRESEHLNGDNPMEAIMEKLVKLMQKRNLSLPMRPDHGFLHSFEKTELYPGYSLMGRMKGLAELRGLELGIQYGSK
ncbi:mannonate dehydratase [Galbibacter sp. EGI 63066]|nr:mannonate dehydratase [Galbibacter sp. EGI 63066]